MAKPLVTKRSQYKIRINLGPVQLGFLGFPNKHNPDFQKDKTPAAFIAEPSDRDGLILYLASHSTSTYATGFTVTIDGGMSGGGQS